MLKKIINIVFVFGLLTSSVKPVEIDKSNLFVPERLGQIKVMHDENNFSIVKNGQAVPVQNAFVDKRVRNMPTEDLLFFLGALKKVEINGQEVVLARVSQDVYENIMGNNSTPMEIDEDQKEDITDSLNGSAYLVIEQLDNGEYCIHARHRILGGGGIGAVIGFWIGKIVVHGVVQGVAYGTGAVVGIFCPPAGVVVGATLSATLAPLAEAASNVVGLTCGIALGTATGPL